jgi:hypothetical protein
MTEEYGMMIAKGKSKYSERNLLPCHFVHHRFHVDYLEIELDE